MFHDVFSEKMSPRRWVAWKLVQLAFKICDTEYHETLTVTTPDGQRVVEWLISGDAYGGGVFAQDTSGCPDGYLVEWTDKWPDYMENVDACGDDATPEMGR